MTSKRLEALLNNLTLVESSNRGSSPQLERDLGQIALESNILKSKLNNDQGLSATAHYFLAQSGANTQDISESLKTIDTRITFQSSEHIKNTDIESYLHNFQKTNVIKTIEEARRSTRSGFLDRLDNSLNLQWEESQQKILEDWDCEQEDKLFGRRATGGAKLVQEFRQQLLAYASIVKELNQNRLLSERIPIIRKFKSLSSYTKCDKSQARAFLDSWNIVSNLSNELRETGSLVEGVYSHSQFDKSAVVKLNRSLIESGKNWLESEYTSYINDTLQKNASVAKVGGTPSVERKLHSFMKLTFSRNAVWTDQSLEIQQDIPIWLYLYLLIRSGHPDLAVAFVDREVQSFYLSHRFPGYLKEYLSSPTKILSEQSRIDILAEYQAMVYGNVPADPYKILLYKIIGRCELQILNVPPVINTTEDFMWFELSLIRENVEEERYSYEKYRLSNLQIRVSSAGSLHFDPNGSNPWLYFKVLLLSMQFEKAIEYLYNSGDYKLEAVHFAIALANYGLIRIPRDPRSNIYDLLITEPDGNVSLNFSRLINQYVRLFIYDDSDNALQYLYLITLYPTNDMMTLCRQQIIQYIVESKEHKKLIGYTNAHGNLTSQSSIEKFKSLYGIDMYDDQLYKDSILYPIAKKFQEKGDYENAVRVFELSKKYTEAVRVLNHQLDLALNIVDGNEVNGETIKLVDFSCEIKSMYDTSIYIDCSEDALVTYNILLGFLRAFVTFSKKQYVQTVEIIQSVNVLPKENTGASIKYAIDRLKTTNDDIFCKHIPKVLHILLDSYHHLHVGYSKHDYNLYDVNQKNIESIKNEVSIITSFLGSVDLDVPHDVFRELNKKIACFGR